MVRDAGGDVLRVTVCDMSGVEEEMETGGIFEDVAMLEEEPEVPDEKLESVAGAE